MERKRKSAPGPAATSETIVLDTTVYALQKALALENQAKESAEIIKKLQEIADKTLRFTMPIFPQKDALDLFVEKSMSCFPEFFGSCGEDIELLHHLQRYAACYLAYKSGYFDKDDRGQDTTKSLRIKILPLTKPRTASIKYKPPKLGQIDAVYSGGETSRRPDTPGSLSESGRTAIGAFLAGCHPPMSHLFERFQRARITGEIHLQVLARRNEEDLRKYLLSSEIVIAQTALEVEALVQAFVEKKSEL